MFLPPNSLILNRYLIVRQIGQGGMGAVYEAKDQRLGHQIALKQLLITDDTMARAFEREARMLARLDHPGLPHVSDYFSDGSSQFLVMKYIPGDDLESLLLSRGSPFSVGEVVPWAIQLLEALEYLHAHSPPIIHRDIKPANLKLSPQGRIILLDFGISKGGLIDQTRLATDGKSVLAFTPYYAPLEQINAQGTDERSDIYSLAATFYHLLTAKELPTAATRAGAQITQTLDPLLPANQINPQVPVAIANLLAQAMALNPAQRPQSAAAMRVALEQAVSTELGTVFIPPTDHSQGAAPDQYPRTVASPYQASQPGASDQYPRTVVAPSGQAPPQGMPEQYRRTVIAPAQGAYPSNPPANPYQGGGYGGVPMSAPPQIYPPSPPNMPPMGQQAAPKGKPWLAIGGLVLLGIALLGIFFFVLNEEGSDDEASEEPAVAVSSPEATESPQATETQEVIATETVEASAEEPSEATEEPSEATGEPSEATGERSEATGEPSETSSEATEEPSSAAEPPAEPTRLSEKDGMMMLYVPAGEFLMGSLDDDAQAHDHEKPQHPVYLDAFWIDQTQVTNGMFARFVTETEYETFAEQEGRAYVYTSDNHWFELDGTSWQHPRGPESNLSGLEAHPVVHVSWNDAQAYCEWAGRRLPTEAEWEKAARGSDGSIYAWGNSEAAGHQLNFCDSNCPLDWADSNTDDSYQFTAPVGSYPDGASPVGALDMTGNVWEWVADWYDENYYSNSPEKNPQGPDNGIKKVLRGGSWSAGADWQRTAFRLQDPPTDPNDERGFRCASGP